MDGFGTMPLQGFVFIERLKLSYNDDLGLLIQAKVRVYDLENKKTNPTSIKSYLVYKLLLLGYLVVEDSFLCKQATSTT